LAECLFRAIATITIAIQRRHGWSAQGNTSAVAAPHHQFSQNDLTLG
jgi:hypothetical protein